MQGGHCHRYAFVVGDARPTESPSCVISRLTIEVILKSVAKIGHGVTAIRSKLAAFPIIPFQPQPLLDQHIPPQPVSFSPEFEPGDSKR